MRSETELSQYLCIFLTALGTKLYRQIVGIPMVICCVSLIADMF